MTDLVLLDVSDRVATITLNRPEARNALNGDLLEALTQTVAAADADDAVDVLVITGADPAFCAGLTSRPSRPATPGSSGPRRRRTCRCRIAGRSAPSRNR